MFVTDVVGDMRVKTTNSDGRLFVRLRPAKIRLTDDRSFQYNGHFPPLAESVRCVFLAEERYSHKERR